MEPMKESVQLDLFEVPTCRANDLLSPLRNFLMKSRLLWQDFGGQKANGEKYKHLNWFPRGDASSIGWAFLWMFYC